jgi:16S rRNA U516 pseudouridylate synthase RsuA-like enzyme
MHVGHPVLDLRRIAFAGLTLDNVEQGKWRALTPLELESLRKLIGM